MTETTEVLEGELVETVNESDPTVGLTYAPRRATDLDRISPTRNRTKVISNPEDQIFNLVNQLGLPREQFMELALKAYDQR